MASKFRIAIVTDDGDPVHLHPGGQGERDLVEALVQHIVGKGVGFFKTEAQVTKAITEGISEVIYQLKSEVVP